ncbi:MULTISPECIES: hypothetical protein [unclassified Streptomyces]|uniref:hypothetical protein n=1 Tax=unclassified Streptomyces TaxID=2593676 RepID=UPI00131A3693|nr:MULTISPECIES: hypothetical protein [unclassified Streptomyces]MYX36439.1 hypothetical protein [Streptomyces sp. SID8377]
MELSRLPEVAALATELTTLFKFLDVTQQQYAVRVNVDKSYVSRFLNGRRVASSEFMDRLLDEIAKKRGTPVTDETRQRLVELRGQALRAFDPELYKMETLRQEVDRSQREIRRLTLHQQGLELLLERRQAEANEIRLELSQLQGDWVMDRVNSEATLLSLKGDHERLKDERDELLREISRLKVELEATHRQKMQVEARCSELEEKIEATEISISVRYDEEEEIESAEPPLGAVKQNLKILFESSTSAALREMYELARSRSGADVAELSTWLKEEYGHRYARQLLSDYSRQAPVQFVAQLTIDVYAKMPPRLKGLVDLSTRAIVDDIRDYRSLEEVIEICSILHNGLPEGESEIIFDIARSWVMRRENMHHLVELHDAIAEISPSAADRFLTKLSSGLSVRDHIKTLTIADRADIAEKVGRRWLEVNIEKSRWTSIAVGLNGVTQNPQGSVANALFDILFEHCDAPSLAVLLHDSVTESTSRSSKEFAPLLAHRVVRAGLAGQVLAGIKQIRVLHLDSRDRKRYRENRRELLRILRIALTSQTAH